MFPKRFGVQLTNITDNDIILPEPSINCGDNFDGSVWVRVHAPKPSNTGSGCGVSKWKWPAVTDSNPDLEDLTSPVNPSSCMLPKTSFRLKADDAGLYDFSAEYLPPFLSPEDQARLASKRIAYPTAKLQSAHLVFRHL